MTNILLLRVTCPDEDCAKDISEHLVRARLAACANIEGPVGAIYRWDGEIQHDQEWVIWLKVNKTTLDRAEALILEKHPYDTPAIVAIPCVHANRRYADWVNAETED